ncbi:MAG: hypothetical protein EU532_08630 [Promethearchaeota archaeon]|nr:MAG: hypothetical protein EU532_08630 [Candidatus Lokiarchaeota archaeon]
MRPFSILKAYNLIKINPSPEIWLKSMKVRMRMVKILMNNITQSLNRLKIPYHKYQLTEDSTRILFFFNNENLKKAMEALEKIFGIESFSPALRTSNRLENIIQRTIEVSKEVLEVNDSFAIRVKRSGKHEYTSQDVAKKVGQAILDNFSHLNLKVNLSNPLKTIFIEVRGEFTYIFTDIIKTRWAGLPIERNKKILCMDVGRINDLIAGFLLMRRGCEIYPVLFKMINKNTFLENWISNWKEISQFYHKFPFKISIINLFPVIEKIKAEMKDTRYLCAICRLLRFDVISRLLKKLPFTEFERIQAFSDGISLNNSTSCNDEIDLASIGLTYLFSEFPLFTPLIGLEAEEVNLIISDSSKNLENIDYCAFKPKYQEIEKEELRNLYEVLNLNDLINEALKNIEQISIT